MSPPGDRGLLAWAGVVLASVMAALAVTVSVSLTSGFDRAADRADLPDVIARFDRHDSADALRRARALPNIRDAAVRYEADHLFLAARGHHSDNASIVLVEPGRRGYAVVAGRDLRDGSDTEAVVERGVADAWHLRPGALIQAGHLRLTVVGISLTPDNVAFPLAAVPRLYASGPGIRRRFGVPGQGAATQVLLWVNDRRRLDVTLTQARATSAGLGGLRILTRSGTAVLIDGAAGIVVALLAAFSLVALGSAAVMLAASAQSAVRRRLPELGVLRAAGATRVALARREASGALRRAAAPVALGTLAGWLAARGPIDRLLEALNEVGPGPGIALWLAACAVGVTGVVALASAWPAWRATAGPPAGLLRGAGLSLRPAGRAPAHPLLLGARALASRRLRMSLSVAVIAGGVAVVLLMLALASLLAGLRDDPGSLGRRYQLTARLPADRVGEVRALPGVADAAPRYAIEAADSFRLGETVRVIAFPGDHTRFEAPPLAEGRRLRSDVEVEVGTGLADVLGLHPGSTLALQFPGGREARFRVSGLVRSLEADGRVAYVRPPRLLAAAPGLEPAVAIRLADAGRRDAVIRALRDLGAAPQVTGAATTRSRSFLATLGNVLRVVAVVNGLFCLYAVLAALALVAGERRGLVALLRATGARRRDVLAVFGGAAALLVAAAAPVALVAERVGLGPLLGHLAANYASLSLTPTPGQTLVVVAGLALIALLGAGITTQRALATPVVAGLGEQ